MSNRSGRLIAFAVLAAGLSLIWLWSLVASPRAATPTGSPPGRSSDRGPVPDERYLWRPVAIGGGGFITGMSSDSAGRTRVIRTDVHGAYRWDARDRRWKQLATAASMPAAYRTQSGVNVGAYAIAVAPGDAERIYMAIKDAVLRSDDGGRTWSNPASRGLPHPFDANDPFRLYGPFIAVSPDDPDLLILGTRQDGLWRSTDGARHWTRVAQVPPGRYVKGRAGAPAQSPGVTVWAEARRADGRPARMFAASAGNGVFQAAGAGPFSRMTPADMPQPRSVARAAMLPDGAMIVTDHEAKRVWAYRDGAWRDLTAGPEALPAAPWLGVAASRGGMVVLSDEGGKLWCSLDRGAHWERPWRSVSVGEGDPPWLHVADQSYFASGEIAFDPVRPERLWVASGVGPFWADVSGGCQAIHWHSQVAGIEELVANDVVQPPGYAPLFAAWDFGIHRKPDLDAWSTTYGPRERVLIAAQQVDWSAGHPNFVVTNASDTRNCCAQDGDAVMAGYSEDGGRTWHKFATLPVPPGTSPTDPWRMSFGTIAVAAGDVDNIVWEPAYYRSPFYTLDRGRSWARVVLPGEVPPLTGAFGGFFGGRKTLAADRVLPATFYLVHSGSRTNRRLTGVWRTDDGGRNWRRIYAGEIAPHSDGSAKLRAVPGFAGNLFFTSGLSGDGDTRLRRSVDGGRTWTALGQVDRVDDIGFGKAAAGRRYPTLFISGRVGGRYGIWRSTDAAASWQRLADFPVGRLDQVSVVEGDQNVFGRVYVGYIGSGWLYGEPAPCRAAPVLPFDSEECAAVTAG